MDFSIELTTTDGLNTLLVRLCADGVPVCEELVQNSQKGDGLVSVIARRLKEGLFDRAVRFHGFPEAEVGRMMGIALGSIRMAMEPVVSPEGL